MLTDLEICKRIAEIEKSDDSVNCYQHESDGICIDAIMCGMVFREAYNPLTDDALCFKLMVKYEINLTSIDNVYDDKTDREYTCFKQGAYQNVTNTLSINESPNKAICLAIIEANK